MIIEAFKTDKQKKRARLINSLETSIVNILSSFPMKILYSITLIALLTAVDSTKETNQTQTNQIEQRQ
jgi:hypothetical protein